MGHFFFAIKKIALLLIMSGTLLYWWQSRVQLTEVEEELRASVQSNLKKRLAQKVSSVRREFEAAHELVSDDPSIEVTSISCDSVLDINKVAFFMEGNHYKKFLHRDGDDFPPFKIFLLEEGIFEKSQNSISFFPSHGRTFEYYPLLKVKYNNDVLETFSYFGRPMHGLFCVPSIIQAIVIKNEGVFSRE